MSNTLVYKFDFRPNPAKNGGALGFASIKVFVGNIPMLILEGYAVREGKDGLWLAPPSRDYIDKKTGEKRYQKYCNMWPRANDGEGDNNEFNKAFERAFRAAWDEYSGSQGETPAPAQAPQVVTTRAPATVAPSKATVTTSRSDDLDIFAVDPMGGRGSR